MIKVMLVDDHELVRTGIRSFLSQAKDISIIAEAATGEIALRLSKERHPDVVLMDLQMPGMGGLEATRKLVRSSPDIKVIAVTAHDKDPLPSRLLEVGAAGFLTKDCHLEEILQAIRKVYSGQYHMSPALSERLALKQVRSPHTKSPLEQLSARELEVMTMITNGSKVKEISETLHLSAKTINSYRYRIFEKLSIDNDVKLTHIAIQYGLLKVGGFEGLENVMEATS
ncbi:MAG: UvrY/SirA/GacA family response regulator transcription factor [Gammaproteobacteria bacterium]|nr:UvrY/SirA/GacA family response regulator transcription factor [Gammaproteobacteria bacterium]